MFGGLAGWNTERQPEKGPEHKKQDNHGNNSKDISNVSGARRTGMAAMRTSNVCRGSSVRKREQALREVGTPKKLLNSYLPSPPRLTRVLATVVVVVVVAAGGGDTTYVVVVVVVAPEAVA